ncbi:MAG: hypothetical protein LAP39_04600 [Acidobacteriia bacterium]|nr:hypothetical protein [Terriglobia bacterium]
MLIRLYRLLLRLFPASYRSTFSQEMANVFQLALADAWSRGVLRATAFCIREFSGLALGAVRAQARRSQVQEQPATSFGPAFDAVPTFYTCEDYAPRRSALFQGGILSLAFFGAVTAAFEYGVNHRIFRMPPGAARDTAQSQFIETGETGFVAFGKSMASSSDGALMLVLGTHPAVAAIDVKLGAVSLRHAWSNLVWVLRVHPNLRLLAPGAFQRQTGPSTGNPGDFEAVYFRASPVLVALDADRDQLISAGEIANAPVVLKSLDKNHDGKLTAEECGGPALPYDDSRAFMRFHPVLAALDADHDGEISASETENAPAALRTLDRNHDGKLTLNELLPKLGIPVQ